MISTEKTFKFGKGWDQMDGHTITGSISYMIAEFGGLSLNFCAEFEKLSLQAMLTFDRPFGCATSPTLIG
jgi:hypothetical protein